MYHQRDPCFIFSLFLSVSNQTPIIDSTNFTYRRRITINHQTISPN